MFDELTTCKPEELQEHAKRIAKMLNTDNAETFIRILWNRVPELYWRSKRLTAQYKVMHTAA